MSEGATSTSPPVRPAAADEATGGNSTDEQDGASNSREVRCSGCIIWNRQQTWLCVVPLLIGFIGLGLSLMLLKWIVVGSVKDYVPTDLVDAKGIGQDPIFLSKPSSYPKNPETTTTTTSRTPNRISTRITTTTQSPKSIPTARDTTHLSSRSPTLRRTTSSATILSSAVPITTTALATRPLPGTPTTRSMPTWPTATYSTSSNKFYLHDSTPSWTIPHFQESTTVQDTISTTNPKFPTTTYSTERSEHFKPCKDKDLAYCLNDGECFVIETLTGSHKHCRCKEGYQGVRCDQFLPKTDSILSDPTDHLGIEFMESEDDYQRQVLSVSCITFGIITVGMFCAVFYIKTKKQRLKIQEQLKDIPNVKNYILNASNITTKSEHLLHNSLQLQNYTKTEKHSEPAAPKVMESCFSHTPSFPEASSADRGNHASKQQRSLSSCCSPGQRAGMLQRNAFRRTPPLPRGRLNGIGGPAYRQLQEPGLMEQDSVHYQGYSSATLKSTQNTILNMQPTSREKKTYLNNMSQKDIAEYSTTRANSVPIIPSVVLEDACMQMQSISEVSDFKNCKNSHSSDLVNVNTPGSPCLMVEHQDVEILLETVQEQIRILTNARRRSEDYELAIAEPEDIVSENTAFLPMTPLAKPEREMQFVFKNESQRDSTLTK